MPPTDGLERAGLDTVQGRVRLVVVDGDQCIKTVAHRCRQALGHALRQQRPGLVSGSPYRAAQTPNRPARERARRGARRAPAPGARRCAQAVALRLRGTAPAVLRRRYRTCTDAGIHRCAADARRPSAAGGRRRGSSRRRPAAGPRTSGSPRRSPGDLVCEAQPIVGPRRRAISRRSASRKVASRIRRGRRRRGRRPARFCPGESTTSVLWNARPLSTGSGSNGAKQRR